MLLKKVF